MLKVLVTIFFVLAIIAADMSIVLVQSSDMPVHGQQGGGNIWPWHKTHVSVVNNLGDGVNLFIHCRSKNDDLGPYILPNGNHFRWSFKLNFLLTTLFWCNIRWVSGSTTLVKSFDIYYAKRDNQQCIAKCYRSIQPDGVYFYDEFKNIWWKEYAW
ncbi:S-protein homolog 29-like [Lotus japonicus]|uniref:S-protein homolog 29-like n=1 Tax=Lotus japonicus TaxID=34305 RepID=UPI002582C69D|nr:S-protein homolog 29-like [Lotus japonicus]